MAERAGAVLPVLLNGVLSMRLPGDRAADLLLDGTVFARIEPAGSIRQRRHFVPVPAFAPGSRLRAIDPATGDDWADSPVTLLPPTRSGCIERVVGRFVFGTVEAPEEGAGAGEGEGDSEATVLAFVDGEVVAHAIARRAEPGADMLSFVLPLPTAVTEGRPAFVHLALAGGTGTLAGGPIRAGSAAARPAPRQRRAARPLRMAIKIAAPDLRTAPHWSDTHLARGLKAALERLGWLVRIDPLDTWYGGEATDIDLVLRGPARYRVDPGRLSLMWLLGDPDRIEADEPAGFDHVFIASDVDRPRFERRHGVPCSTLHRATDPARFASIPAAPVETPLLFVGDSGRAFRPMVRWCIERRLPLAIWGANWEGLVPPDLVRGAHLPFEHRPAAYAAAGIVLTDHRDARGDTGFLSSRLFDGSAAGVPVLTDPVAGLAAVFGDTIPAVASAEALAAEVEAILSDPQAARTRAQRARDIVRAAHTFDHRAQRLVETVEALGGPRGA